MKTNFIIETSQEYFCNWLEDFTRNAPLKNFPTDKGYISLQTARPAQYGNSSNRYMRMEGFYVTPTEGETQTAYPISSIVEFKIVPLNQNRIEIVAECSQKVVEDYFRFLLDEINKRWAPVKNPEQQISHLRETVIDGFSEIKESQAALLDIQGKVTQISDAIHDGQIEQGGVAILVG